MQPHSQNAPWRNGGMKVGVGHDKRSPSASGSATCRFKPQPPCSLAQLPCPPAYRGTNQRVTAFPRVYDNYSAAVSWAAVVSAGRVLLVLCPSRHPDEPFSRRRSVGTMPRQNIPARAGLLHRSFLALPGDRGSVGPPSRSWKSPVSRVPAFTYKLRGTPTR